MYLYLGTLTLHENLFYATREVGRLYETGRYLHNYALTYALGLAVAPYFHAEQTPRYAEQLLPLNDRGVYVTPARGLRLSYALNTFKYADNAYHVEMEKGAKNTPSFGRAKEIAVGSAFQFAVLAPAELTLPVWVRLGLWRSKAAVSWRRAEARRRPAETAEAALPLNPLDLPVAFQSFDLISMPPSSLLDHVTLRGDWWLAEFDGAPLRLPAGMAYRFPLEAR
jgi:CRISPR-associated protein Csc1